MFVNSTWVLVLNPHKKDPLYHRPVSLHRDNQGKPAQLQEKGGDQRQAEEARQYNQRRPGICNLERDLRHLGGDRGDGEEDGEEQAEEDQGEDRLLHRGHPPRQLLDDLDAEKRPEDSGPSQSH